MPKVFGFVLLFAFGLLLVSFRSIVIAVKAIILNLLSVAAAYGVIVAFFQWGWGESLLELRRRTAASPTGCPMFMFVILFGLSMDYHVFILSRIREGYDRGLSTDNAIAYGIKSTAGVVTSAAVVMVAVFLVFTMLPLVDLKEMGIGLAAAVLIDATIVRARAPAGLDEAARQVRTGTSRAGSSGCRGSSTSAAPSAERPLRRRLAHPPPRAPAPPTGPGAPPRPPTGTRKEPLMTLSATAPRPASAAAPRTRPDRRRRARVLLASSPRSAAALSSARTQTQRDDDGYYASGRERRSRRRLTRSSPTLDVGTDGPDWLFETAGSARSASPRPARPRTRSSSASPPVAGRRLPPRCRPRRDHRLRAPPVLRHLDSPPGHRHARRPDDAELLGRSRGRDRRADGDLAVREGSWAVVVMNADGTPGVGTDVASAPRSGFMLWLGIGAPRGRRCSSAPPPVP